MDKRKFTMFIIGVCMVSIASNLAHPVTPTLIVERGLDSSMFGVALAAMQTVYFLLAPFWGRVCDYIPSRTVLLICCCGYAVGQFIFGSAHSETVVLLGRMFAGLFTGGVFTAMANYVVNTSDTSTRGSRITTYSTFNNVFNAVGYFIGGMVGLISVEVSFGFQVALLIGCGIFFRLTCVDDTPFKEKPEHPMTFKDANPFAVFVSAKSFMTPALALLFVIVAVGNLGQTAFEQVFNYYIKDQLGLSSAYNGIFKAAIAVLTFAANTTIVMKIIKKTDTNVSFMPVIVSSVLPLALILVFKGVVPFAICDITFFVIAAMRFTLLQNLTASKGTPETSNRIMGFFQSMTALGGIFGAFFAGVIYESDPMSPFRLALAAVAVGAALSVLYVCKYSKNKSKQ